MAGIYIHIPFCKQACTYCNFYFSTALKKKDAFLNAIIREIDTVSANKLKNEPIETVYFGGGTPSLLETTETGLLLDTIARNFSVSSDAEITLEANPDDIEKSKLQDWISLGINRLSLGVQSFYDPELRWMNRAHSAEDALNSIDIIREAGINNFSADLIFGSPLLSNETLEKNLRCITEKEIPHLSCYGLTVEPRTALHKMIESKKSIPVNNEQQASQFLLVMDFLEHNGYEQYEISNYAKTGYQSRHNSSYWEGKPYYGFGPSAHSFDGNTKRRWNVSDLMKYIRLIDSGECIYEEEILNHTQQMNEHIMISLRKKEGIDLNIFSKKFGENNALLLDQRAIPFVQTKQLLKTGAHLRLTTDGKLFADHISAELFFERSPQP